MPHFGPQVVLGMVLIGCGFIWLSLAVSLRLTLKSGIEPGYVLAKPTAPRAEQRQATDRSRAILHRQVMVLRRYWLVAAAAIVIGVVVVLV